MSTSGDEEKAVIKEVASHVVTSNTVPKPEPTATTTIESDLEMPTPVIAEAPSSATEDEEIPPGFSKLDNPDPAVEQLYDEGLGEEGNPTTNALTEPLLPQSESNDDDDDEGGCCNKMKKYKGVWFLLLTLLVLVGIATGIVFGAKKDDDDDDDDDETFSPTTTPIRPVPTTVPTATLMPTASSSSNVIPDKMNYCVGDEEDDVDCSFNCLSDNDCSFGLTCIEYSDC